MIETDKLNSGIRRTVVWLRENGFNTCDSGDGVTMEFECDPGRPYVHCRVEHARDLIAEANRLAALVRAAGVSLFPMNDDNDVAHIEAHYTPVGDYASVTLWNVSDETLFGGGA